MDVDYGVIAQAEKKEGLAIIALGSPTVLDKETWNAVNVPAAAVAGHLTSPSVHDYTGDVIYLKGDFPAEIPLGSDVRAWVNAHNDGDRHTFHITRELIDPDGNSRGTKESDDEIRSGYSLNVATEHVILDKEGIWQIHAILED